MVGISEFWEYVGGKEYHGRVSMRQVRKTRTWTVGEITGESSTNDETRVPSSASGFFPSSSVGDCGETGTMGDCCETSTTNGVCGATYADDVAYGDSLRRRRM